MVRRYSGDRQRLPALRRGWRSVGGPRTATEAVRLWAMCACVKLRFWPTHRRLVLAGVQHHLSFLSVMLLSCCCPSSFRSLPHHEEPHLERKVRLSSGGGQVQVASRSTSINLHQLKVEEDRHALYQISANYIPSSSRSLQTTTFVVLTIINDRFLNNSHNQCSGCSVQCYRNSTATATRYGPSEGTEPRHS